MKAMIIVIFVFFTFLIIFLMCRAYKSKKIIKLLYLISIFSLYVYLFFTTDGSVRLSLILYGYPKEACTVKIKINKNMSTKNIKYILPTKRINKYPSYFECKSYGALKVTTYYGF